MDLANLSSIPIGGGNQQPPPMFISPGAAPPPPGLGGPPGGLPPLPTMEMDAYLDETFFNIFELVINCVIINALSIAGSVGNILCIYILSLHGFDNSTNVTLVSLAVADLLILITLPLRKISLIIEPFNKALSITVESHVVRYNFLTLNRVWSLISNAHVALIAVERFLAVYFPFQVTRWTTAPRMTVIVMALHVVFYVMLFPMFSMFKLVWLFDPNLNETIAIPAITDFYMAREKEFNFYNSYIVNLLMGALFLFITVVCCIGISIKLVSLSKIRKSMTGSAITSNSVSIATFSNNKTNPTSVEGDSNPDTSMAQDDQSRSRDVTSDTERHCKSGDLTSDNKRSVKPASKTNTSRIDIKVVKLLLIVCIVYLLLIFPSFLLFVFQEVYKELREAYWRRVNFLATSISMFLIALNSSLNFVIYVANSQKFYGTLKVLFGRGKSSNKIKNTK